ncbi:MAG: hypothetical protein HQ569_03595 [Actinobacteria bacterium]|nr:hypothetical protein [Actinomycetota bacterium]
MIFKNIFGLQNKFDIKTNNFKKINFIVLIICLLPIIFSFIYVFYYGVNLVFYDQWNNVVVIDKIINGTFHFSDLLKPHNEHIIFFPNIFVLLIAFLTKYNTIVEMYIIIFLLIISFYIFYLYFKKKFNSKKASLWFIAIPFLIFSLKQNENMLWGWQIIFLFPLVFSLITFYLIFILAERKNLKINITIFISSIVCGTIASFSSMMGILVWPSGFFQLLLLPIRKKKKIFYTVIWSFIGLIEGILYFLLVRSNMHVVKKSFIMSPVDFLKTFFISTGGTLFWDRSEVSFVVGIIIVAMVLACVVLLKKNNRLKENSFSIAVMIFSLLTIFIMIIGRNNAYDSRYTTYTILLIVSLYIMLVDLNIFTKNNFVKTLVGILIGFIILSIPISYYEGIIAGQKTKVERQRAAFILSTYDKQPSKFLKVLSGIDGMIESYAPTLIKLNYNIFSKNQNLSENLPEFENLVINKHQFLFNIDETLINDVIIKQEEQIIYPITDVDLENDFVVIRGWAVDSVANDAAAGVYIEVDKKLFPTYYGIDKREIADYYKEEAYRYSGFERAIPLSDIGGGNYHNFNIIILSKDGKTYYKEEIAELFYPVIKEDYIVSKSIFNNRDKSRFKIYVDSPQENGIVSGEIIINGWAVDTINVDYEGRIDILFYDGPKIIDEKYLGKAHYYLLREDVANHFGIDEYRFSGFEFLLDTNKLEKGKHNIYIYALNNEGVYSSKVLGLIVEN